jgi:hypothetical protein
MVLVLLHDAEDAGWRLASRSSARHRRTQDPAVGSKIFCPGEKVMWAAVSVTAYHSFAGEVEALNTPTIRRLTPSCRHQLPPIARLAPRLFAMNCPLRDL